MEPGHRPKISQKISPNPELGDLTTQHLRWFDGRTGLGRQAAQLQEKTCKSKTRTSHHLRKPDFCS